jgi:hypothetical protein
MKLQEVGESCIMRSSITYTRPKYNQVKEDAMGMASSTNGEKLNACIYTGGEARRKTTTKETKT